MMRRFYEQPLCVLNLAAIRSHGRLGAEGADVRPHLNRALADNERFVVTSGRLEDRGAQGLDALAMEPASLDLFEVRERLHETMEGRPCLRASQERCWVSRRLTYELLGNLLGALVIRNASQELPAHRDQLRDPCSL